MLRVSHALAEVREDRQRDKLHYCGQQILDGGGDVADDIAADKGYSFGYEQAEIAVAIEWS